jgi:hypothetical protein
MRAESLLVIIPHSSTRRPPEIKKDWLSPHQKQFLFGATAETDRFTDRLYDFRELLKNQQQIFRISQVYVNICRNPANLNEAVPLFIGDLPVYQKGKELNEVFQRRMLIDYYFPFYEELDFRRKRLIFIGHSTIAGHRSLNGQKLEHDIVLSDCPGSEKYAVFYKSELKKRWPGLKIGRNSIYQSVDDNVCSAFALGTPMVHQETNEALYIVNSEVIEEKLEKLNRLFAQALFATMKNFGLAE